MSLRLSLSVLACAAFMAVAGSARADCSIGSFDATRGLVETFMFEQGSLLRSYPRGGPGMINRVSVIVASSKAAMPQIMRAIRLGNIEQRQAAGGGMALAARLCEKTQPSTARLIERTAKAYADPAFLREFDKYYKSRSDLRAEADEAARAAQLRQQIGAPASSGGSPRALGREMNIPLSGTLKSVKPIEQAK